MKCELHENKVNLVKQKILDDEMIFEIADFFKVFSDSTRIKIVCALLESDLCVCDIANITNSTQSAISHQLRLLKQNKLVKYTKVGKTVYYSLADDHIKEILTKGREHLEEK